MGRTVVAPQPILKNGDYRHMARRDAVVWERFIERYGGAYIGVAYDVALGGISVDHDPADAEYADAYRYSTALKIDAVLFTSSHALIVEVRPWATVSALGSVLAYTLVAQRDRLLAQPFQPAIVCEGIQLDVRWCCDQIGVVIFEV